MAQGQGAHGLSPRLSPRLGAQPWLPGLPAGHRARALTPAGWPQRSFPFGPHSQSRVCPGGPRPQFWGNDLWKAVPREPRVKACVLIRTPSSLPPGGCAGPCRGSGPWPVLVAGDEPASTSSTPDRPPARGLPCEAAAAAAHAAGRSGVSHRLGQCPEWSSCGATLNPRPVSKGPLTRCSWSSARSSPSF